MKWPFDKDRLGKENFVRSPCEVCGYLTQFEHERGRFFICPVCFWEDDGFHDNPDEECELNYDLTLNQAKDNFKSFKACRKEVILKVRRPKPDEIPK